MKESERDVVIVGGSFAGLATAHFIRNGEVLVLERQNELGKMQRSTCCTSLGWIERLGCSGAILKKIDTVKIYSSDSSNVKVKLPETFCTFDYRVFCKTLAGNLRNADVRTGEKVVEIKGGHAVLTESGVYNGSVVVDASGWPGVSDRRTKKNSGWKSKPAFGLEVETDYAGDTDSLHIFYGKRYTPHGYGWVFPTGKDKARIGIGGQFSLKPRDALDQFLAELEIKSNGAKPHGGYLPVLSLGEPVNNGVFVVGDSCNQVIPASGEGIRKTFEYSEICAQIVHRILEGGLSLDAGLAEYSKAVLESKAFYDNMRFIQDMAHFCPDFARRRLIESLLKEDEAKTEAIMKRYLLGDIRSSKAAIVKSVIKSLFF
jgi:flavin-dependent dehydrogenase